MNVPVQGFRKQRSNKVSSKAHTKKVVKRHTCIAQHTHDNLFRILNSDQIYKLRLSEGNQNYKF